MERLIPSFLDWGPWLWRGIALAAGLLALAIVIAIRYLLARDRGKRAGRAIRTDPGALRGVLRGATPGVLAQQIEVEAYNLGAQQPTSGTAEWRAPEVWLDTGEQRIQLVGPLRVVAGTRHAGRRGELPALSAEARDALHAQLPWATRTLRSALAITLADGDEIAVRGLPQPRPGGGEATAREADIAWSLEGTAEAPLELAAIATQAPRLSFGLVRGVVVVGLVAGLTTIAIRSHARTWEDECRVLRSRDNYRAAQVRAVDEPLEPITGDHPCILAATVLGDRDEAVSNIYDLVEHHPYRDAQVFDALLDVRREARGHQPRCNHLFDLYNGGLYELALREARLCGDRYFEHASLASLGRFEEAVAIEAPNGPYVERLPSLGTLIATKRWREAAEQVDERATRADADELPRLQCFAALLHHHAGDRDAVTRLRELTAAEEAKAEPDVATTYTTNPCLAVLAQVDPVARERWLARPADNGSWETSQLRVAAGHTKAPGQMAFEEALSGTGALAIAWLPIDVAPTDPRPQRLLVLRQRAIRAVMDRDPVAAKRAADEAVAFAAAATDDEVGLDVSNVYASVQYLPDVVALYTPQVFPFRQLTYRECDPKASDRKYFECSLRERRYWGHGGFSVLQLRNPEPIRSSDVRDAAVYEEVKQSGDGKALLGRLRPGGDLYWTDLELLAILPHVKTHRDSLARELPLWGPPRDYGDLFVGARRAVVRRTLFEQLDRPDEAAQWHAVYRRFAEVFEDRDRLIALVLSESIR